MAYSLADLDALMMINTQVTDRPATANHRKDKAMNAITAFDKGELPRGIIQGNEAAWLTGKRGGLEISPAPYTTRVTTRSWSETAPWRSIQWTG